jgi:hypothetical protein
VLLAWVPLLVLSIIQGNAWGSSVALTFLQDIETHVRLLIAVPLFILAEVKVHRELPAIARCFVDHELVPQASRPQFQAAISSAIRLRNSVAAELLLIAFVYSVVVPFIWRDQVALDVNSWYATTAGGHLQASLAGWWMALVSMPVFIFLSLRWYFRFFIWARFQWQVSRIDLNLQPTHPDGTAGLHFLALAERAYRLVLLAFGTVLAAMIANRIFQTGAALPEFKVEIVGTVVLLVFFILGPMLAFTPKLIAVRHRGTEEYGRLGQRYAREFDRKWIRGNRPAGEALLGSPDIQSLADLRNGFLVVKHIRVTPFDARDVAALAASILLPVAPLLLTMFSVEQILQRVLKAFI